MTQRIQGLDVARAMAIFGMVIVNFKIAMEAKVGNELLLWITGLFEGRASALFVILAGIGITMLSDKARLSLNQDAILSRRLSILKRGVLLVLIGLAYTPVWPADILHFYGFYFIIAAFIYTSTDRALLFFSVAFTLLFPLMLLIFDYEKGWNWETLAYQNFWTLDGMVRHIIFNGFHPVVPWASFLIFGMWLGRQDLNSPVNRKRLLFWSSIALATTEVVFYLIRSFIENVAIEGLTTQELEFLFSTSIIPPLPQYIVSATSSSIIVLIASLYFSEKFSAHKVNRWLIQTGQLSLTLYVAHVIVGMGVLESLGLLKNQQIAFSLASALVFCVGGVVFSVLWLKRFKTGPLEWVFRKVAS